MPKLPRCFHQSGEEAGDYPPLPGKTKIIELEDGGNAQFQKRDSKSGCGIFGDRCIGIVATEAATSTASMTSRVPARWRRGTAVRRRGRRRVV